MVVHYMKCIGTVVAADPLKSMEKLSLYYSVLNWWTNGMFFDTCFFTFLCGMASVLHRKVVTLLQYCDIYSAQESHKRNTVVPEVQKIVGCVTSWKKGGLWVSSEHCV